MTRKMFHVRDEGDLIRWGLNVYPRGHGYSRGFVWHGFGIRIYVRWAIRHKHLHWYVRRVPTHVDYQPHGGKSVDALCKTPETR